MDLRAETGNGSWDDIVVGGGSSGAVLASRLSEDPRRRVLLIEAGPDYADEAQTPSVLRDADAVVMRGYNWDYTATVRGGGLARGLAQSAAMLAAAPRDMLSAARTAISAPGPLASTLQQLPYFPGKVIGGSSAVNGAVALRPFPADFPGSLDPDDWSWSQVSPFFHLIETDHDHDGPRHGRTGPMPIVRSRLETLDPVQSAFREACIASGLAALDDLNDDNAAPGVGMLPTNAPEGIRHSTAMTYLGPARDRPNLRVCADTLVERVLFEGRRVAGVQVQGPDGMRVHRASRVTVCAGALNTVGVLMRSGIGDRQRCLDLGIECIADLPGVGEHLMDHPAIMLWLIPRDGAAIGERAGHQVMARLATPGAIAPDLSFFILNGFETARIPMLTQLLRSPRAHALSVVLGSPESRGRVRIESTSATAAPRIELDLCTHPRDLDRLADGVRQAWAWVRSGPLAKHVDSVFLWSEAIVRNDALLRSSIQRFLNAAWHACGTARMGPADDAMSVVDMRFRVHTLDGLRVVDASVLPRIPHTPTNLTCIMLAERAARWMSEEGR